MGAMCVRAFSATTRAQYERQMLIAALGNLRDLRTNLELRCERIEVSIQDFRRNMLEIGLQKSMRGAGAKFTDTERSKFRLQSTKCRLRVHSLEGFHGLLLNIERQTIVMEDAELYRDSVYALRAGVTVGAKYQQAMAGLDVLLESVSEQRDQLDDVQQAMTAAASTGIDDDEILAELLELGEDLALPATLLPAAPAAPLKQPPIIEAYREQPLMLI